MDDSSHSRSSHAIPSKTCEKHQKEALSDRKNDEVDIKLGAMIGVGSFAKVYKVTIKSQSGTQDAALKYIEHSKISGLNSLLEMYITRYIDHACLVRALKVDIDTGGNFQILQSLANTDAATLIRRQGFKLSETVLKRWCWQLVCAVAQLHSHGIVHCDIKAGNVLVFGVRGKDFANSSVKLGDYSVSSLIMDPKIGTRDMGSIISYTSTHRPLEVWKGHMWNFSADIWALGCTFYELAYQALLFPNQQGIIDVKTANIKAIEGWGTYRQSPRPTSIGSPKKLPSKSTDVGLPLPTDICLDFQRSPSQRKTAIQIIPKLDHKTCNIDSRLKYKTPFTDMITAMLTVDSSLRPTIWDLIVHPYFDSIRDLSDLPRHLIFPTLTYPEPETKLDNDIQVSRLAASLYERCKNESPLETCINVAHKLLYKTPSLKSSKISSLGIQDEIALCRNLDFRFLND
jgi:serine/threonine protein kinase